MPEQIIWSNTVDQGAFRVEVTRITDYKAKLVVTITNSGEPLLEDEITLSYAARFGPDVDDVDEWMSRTIKVVNEHLAKQGA
jgi:hypothetical protein